METVNRGHRRMPPDAFMEKLPMTTRIYHNPRCSKSRKTLELLRDAGHEPEIVEYLTNPPTPAEIRSILNLLQCEPRDIMRTTEAEYVDNNLDREDLNEDALVQALHDYPRIMQRPIVIRDGKAAIGRPPENVLGLLGE